MNLKVEKAFSITPTHHTGAYRDAKITTLKKNIVKRKLILSLLKNNRKNYSPIHKKLPSKPLAKKGFSE